MRGSAFDDHAFQARAARPGGRVAGNGFGSDSLFESAEVLREVVEKYGAIEGGKQTLARLDEYVTKSLAD